MAGPSNSSDIINKFMDISHASVKLTAEDYHKAFMEEKDPDIAKLRQMASDLAQSTGRKNKGARSKIESAGFHQKISVEFTTQKCESFFVCHLFIHGILVVSRDGRKMKDSRHNAFEAAMQKLLQPYLRIRASDVHAKVLEASMTPFSSDIQEQSESTSAISGVETAAETLLINKESNRKELKQKRKGYKSIADFVILEPKNPSSYQNADATMRRSANMNEMLLEYEYSFNSDNVKCILRLEDNVLAEAVGTSKSYARTSASVSALQKLRQSCWTIKTKETGPVANTIYDINVVTRNQLQHGISQEGPQNFSLKVREILENYASSKIDGSLPFLWDFNPWEQKAIKQEVSRAKLRGDVTVREGKKYYCVWRPYSKLFQFLKSVGGETRQYKLIPPGQNFQLKTAGNKGGSQIVADDVPSCPSSSHFSSGSSQNANPLAKEGADQLAQRTAKTDACNFGVKIQPSHEEDTFSMQDVQKGISSEGAKPQATSVSPHHFAEDCPPSASDGSDTQEGCPSEKPSSSSSLPCHPQERETKHPNYPGADESKGEADETGCFGDKEFISLESLRKIILFENMGINTDRQLLQDTAGFNKLLVKFLYDKPTFKVPADPGYQIVCYFTLGKKVIASGASAGKASSVVNACHEAVKKMRKHCWCIQVKQPKDDVNIITRSELCGGGPGNDSSVFDMRKVMAFLEMLIRSGNTAGLIFKDEYSNQEVKEIQSLCKRVNLHFNTFRKRDEKFYLLAQKWTADKLFKHLQVLGGESDNHKLVPPLDKNGETDDKLTEMDAMVTEALDDKNSTTLQKRHASVPRVAKEGSFAQVSRSYRRRKCKKGPIFQRHKNFGPRNVKQFSCLQGHEFSTPSHFEQTSSFQGPNLQGHEFSTPSHFEKASSFQGSNLQGHEFSNPSHFEQASSFQGPNLHGRELSNPSHFEQASSFQGSNLHGREFSNPSHFEQASSFQGPNLRGREFSNPSHFEEASSFQGPNPHGHEFSNPRNPELVSMSQTSFDYNQRNSEVKSDLLDSLSSNQRDIIEQVFKEYERGRIRSTDYNYQCSSQEESHCHRRRHNDDNYGGSSQTENLSHRDRNIDDEYHSHSDQTASISNRNRNTDNYRHFSRQTERLNYRDSKTDDNYQASSHGKDSHSCRDEKTYDTYHGSLGEHHDFVDRDIDDCYRNTRREESHRYRDRDVDDDYHESRQGESHRYRDKDYDDYHDSRQGESHRYRDRGIDDDYHDTRREESHHYRDRDVDDDYPDTRRREGRSQGKRDVDEYHGISDGQSSSYGRRNSRYHSNRGGSDCYKPAEWIGHKSSYLEKRRHEGRPMWREENSFPHKFRRGQSDGFYEGPLY